MKTLILSLLAVTSVGSLVLPAYSGDQVNIQDVQQVTTQEGNMNRSDQMSEQKIQNSHYNPGSRPSSDNLGNVQGLYQNNLQVGEGNMTRQKSVQEVKVRNNTSRSVR